jgi:hypothetical protein
MLKNVKKKRLGNHPQPLTSSREEYTNLKTTSSSELIACHGRTLMCGFRIRTWQGMLSNTTHEIVPTQYPQWRELVALKYATPN